MKRMTKLLLGLSVIAALMICMTAVSFAGTAEDEVIVKYRAAEVGDFISMSRNLAVQGDLAEKYYPDIAKYEPEKGVSWLDALVADHIYKYGADQMNDYLGVADAGEYSWVTKAYGKSLLASIVGTTFINPINEVINEGDSLTALIYDDGDYNRTFSYFDKEVYDVTYAEPLTVEIKATSYGTDYPVDDATIAVVDPVTGQFTDVETTFEDGKATVKFYEPGLYFITAHGKVTYDPWGAGETTTDYLGAFALVRVADEQVVSFAAGMPGSIDYFTELLLVNGNNVETYFPELADQECEGISYADALIAAHIEKYGADKVKDYFDMAYNPSWGLVSITKQFGHEYVGFYYLNNAAIPVVPILQPIKAFDDLFAGSYLDYNYSDKYCYFNKTEMYAATGEEITLDFTIDDSGDAIKSSEAVITTFDEKGVMTELEGAVCKDGKATFKFDEPGIYLVSAEGSVTYEPSWAAGTELTGKLAGAWCKVYVENAKPAVPVITSAKRNTKVKATVTWKKAKNAKKYEVAYKVKGAKKWTTKKTAGTKIVLKKLKAKKAYQVKVRSINGSAKSAYSKVKTIKAK